MKIKRAIIFYKILLLFFYLIISFKVIFPGCEKMEASYKRGECANRKIYEFIGKHVGPEVAVKLGLEGTHRVKVAIAIDRKGKIAKLESNSDNKKITKDIKKTFEKFSAMIPYRTRGILSSTRLILPITLMGIPQNFVKLRGKKSCFYGVKFHTET